jgi:hypothetical protein
VAIVLVWMDRLEDLQRLEAAQRQAKQKMSGTAVESRVEKEA